MCKTTKNVNVKDVEILFISTKILQQKKPLNIFFFSISAHWTQSIANHISIIKIKIFYEIYVKKKNWNKCRKNTHFNIWAVIFQKSTKFTRKKYERKSMEISKTNKEQKKKIIVKML